VREKRLQVRHVEGLSQAGAAFNDLFEQGERLRYRADDIPAVLLLPLVGSEGLSLCFALLLVVFELQNS
jgi:5,10-methenyltetrahydromethanopterin hydrogenase